MKKCKGNEHQYEERKRRGVVFVSKNSNEKRLMKCSICGDLAFAVDSGRGISPVIVKKLKKGRYK